MRETLVQMKAAKALKGEKYLLTKLRNSEKEDVMELVYSTIIVYLGDRVLREVLRSEQLLVSKRS